MDTPINKVCSKCDTLKTLEEFYKQKKGKYGHAGVCKVCHNKQCTSSRITGKKIVEDRPVKFYVYDTESTLWYSKYKPAILRSCKECKEYLGDKIICRKCKTINHENRDILQNK